GATTFGPDGTLLVTLDVPLDDDARQLWRVPHLQLELAEDFVDGLGRRWPGRSITRLAAARPARPGAGAGRGRLSLGDIMSDEKRRFEDHVHNPELLPRALRALRAVGIQMGAGANPYTNPGGFLRELEAACLNYSKSIKMSLENGPPAGPPPLS